MSLDATLAVPGAPARDPDDRVAPRWPLVVWAAALLAGATMAWFGGALALAGVLLAGASAAMLARHGMAADKDQAMGTSGSPSHSALRADAAMVGRVGAEVMVEQVVPVWVRQLDTARELTVDGLNRIVESFASISGALGTLASQLQASEVSVQAGAVAEAVQREEPALAALCAASQRAFDERDHMVGELGRCADSLTELGHLAKTSREIARHTRLVAFNASIEAQRGHGGQGVANNSGGAQAVAAEVRMLAGRMAEIGEKIEQQVLRLHDTIGATRRRGEVGDTTPDELRLEVDIAARHALKALIGSLGSALQSHGEAQQAAAALSSQLDEVFMHFQVGDRISQMLAIVGNDMSRLATWVARNPTATQSDAAEWLAALEASYTMEEQRSQHHGNAHVSRDAGVEFF